MITNGGIKILTCKIGNNTINCYDGTHGKEQLKKWAKKRILLCPACNKPYEYCCGKIKSPYFRHMDKTVCVDKYSEPETEEHSNGKRDLYEWIKKQNDVTETKLEGWIPETKQRPDIMFKYKGKQFVLEFQCTPISSEYFERSQLYKAAGINDIWICGVSKYIQYYHKGYGNKRINILEECSRLYYNPMTKQIYKIDSRMEESTFDKILKGKNINLMRNPYDYRCCFENYILVKDYLKSYDSYTYYPSPTGRSSNKYPYPVTDYLYNHNMSLANCYLLNMLKLKSVT